MNIKKQTLISLVLILFNSSFKPTHANGEGAVIALGIVLAGGWCYGSWCNIGASVRTDLADKIRIELKKYKSYKKMGIQSGYKTFFNRHEIINNLAQRCTNYPWIPDFRLINLINRFYDGITSLRTDSLSVENPEKLARQIFNKLHGSF